MSLIPEIPAEIETVIREVAEREGRDLKLYIIEAASEKARREQQDHAARLQALQELADASQGLDLDRIS